MKKRVNNFSNWLFEQEYNEYENLGDIPKITRDEVMSVFNAPNNAPRFDSETMDFEQRAKALIFIVLAAKEIIPRFTLEMARNFTKFLINIDDFRLANATLQLFGDLNPYIKTPEYSPAFDEFRKHYSEDISNAIRGLESPEEEQEEKEIKRDFSELSRREIQELVDQALDDRDFDTVQKLAKYLPESLKTNISKIAKNAFLIKRKAFYM